MKKFDSKKNYEETSKLIGWVPRKEATQKTYDDLGFMSGLEVHQQLLTDEKLFCRCPAGHFHDFEDYDAEIVRHMRPTLSELGEYDGTALMEFRTKKEITYRINNKTACTYEIDDTPPFPINRQALHHAIAISLLLKQNIVGELHITRKQYLDGSIPTGFQRTAIVGIEGEIPLKNKKVRIIQLSIEEDSCREISDIGHKRVYITDRLGIPLIETVTYPDMKNPDEVKEAAQYIRFLNRSSGLVRTGIGAGREDVNVSITGGTRIEIKGVAHNKWIPELTHVEAFRQRSLLEIKKILNERILLEDWKMTWKEINSSIFREVDYSPLKNAIERGEKIIAVNLPAFEGILSFFNQPGITFSAEISDRLKVIACLERPNMIHSEELEEKIESKKWDLVKKELDAKPGDAQIIFWTSDYDLQTALETIEERCQMAFEGVPKETRKSFENGTTIFERVLPGADRMYPDTDSAPIPIANDYIEEIRQELPVDLSERLIQLSDWNAPEDTYDYILRNNLMPLIEKIIEDFNVEPLKVITLFSHTLKHCEGTLENNAPFTYEKVYDLFKFQKANSLQFEILKEMLPIIYENPQFEFKSVLSIIDYSKNEMEKILADVPSLKEMYMKIRFTDDFDAMVNWIMGNLRKNAIGNVSLKELRTKVIEMVK